MKRLEAFQQDCLRRIFGIKWYDKISRVQVIQIVNSYGVSVLPVEVYIRERRLRYLGHIERSGPGRLIYILLHSQAENGSRGKGAQVKAYRHCVLEDMKRSKIDVNTWQTFAQDRDAWRRMVKDGMHDTTLDWERRQAAERETRHAYDEQNAVHHLFMEPAPQRTSKAEQLMQRLHLNEEVISERQAGIPEPVPRGTSRSAWFKQQLTTSPNSINEIRAERLAFNRPPPPLSPTASPYYPGWTHLNVAPEHEVWFMFH